MKYCSSNAITVQPSGDGKLNPFNTDWNTKLFESCNPITDGELNSICFVILYMLF